VILGIYAVVRRRHTPMMLIRTSHSLSESKTTTGFSGIGENQHIFSSL
jgi:hypothetical protein